jgi:16S rRNA (cytidine1402-2'-O)-methyltransferase
MPGILYVVATPIGNLEDVTLRAVRILREVNLIAAEDTRRTARLLQHYSISTPTTSLHEHNERHKTPRLIERLCGGESVALVSDAGTPLVSDPGVRLVAAAHAAGIRVEPIPGPSAVLAALSASGFPTDRFTFVGFPPSKARARRDWLAALANEPGTLVVFEAPHRVADTLHAMLETLGNRSIALCREVTKAHEELVVKPISAAIDVLGEPRGEYTVVVAPKQGMATPARPLPGGATLVAEFGQLTTHAGADRREAIRNLAAKYSLPARQIYRLLEDAKSSIK